jgi:hypothetical protein
MVRKLANECLAVAVNAVLVNKKQENWLLFFIVIKIKEKKKVSVQEQCLLLLQILPKFWSRFQLIGKYLIIILRDLMYIYES